MGIVRPQATRDVDVHGWTAWITDDYTCPNLDGGSVRLDVGLSVALQAYLRSGASFAQEAGWPRRASPGMLRRAVAGHHRLSLP